MDNMKKICLILCLAVFFTSAFVFAAGDMTKDPQYIFITTKERLDKLENKVRAFERRINTMENNQKDMEKMITQIAGDVALLSVNMSKLEAGSKKTGN